MSEVVRLTLVSHAMTDAVSAGRFPTDEPLNPLGRRQVGPSIDWGTKEFTALCGPEQRCLQTAELLGLHPTIESRLADLDCGRWRGDVLGGVESRGSRGLADRPDERAARWRIGPRTDRPSGELARVDDGQPEPHGRGGASGRHTRCHTDRARRATEVVLAHRYRAGKPNADALPRPRLDVALRLVLSGHQREHLIDDRYHPRARAGAIRPGPVRLEAQSPMPARRGRLRTN